MGGPWFTAKPFDLGDRREPVHSAGLPDAGCGKLTFQVTLYSRPPGNSPWIKVSPPQPPGWGMGWGWKPLAAINGHIPVEDDTRVFNPGQKLRPGGWILNIHAPEGGFQILTGLICLWMARSAVCLWMEAGG